MIIDLPSTTTAQVNSKLVQLRQEGGAVTLGRVLTAAGLAVVEVNRPDRATRRANGKSDPVDAYAAAQAVASGRAAGVPKSRDGIVESIGCLRVARGRQ